MIFWIIFNSNIAVSCITIEKNVCPTALNPQLP